MRIYGDELFPAFQSWPTGDSDALRDWEQGRPITGTLAKVDLSKTAEAYTRLQPETRENTRYFRASDSDHGVCPEARRQLDRLEKKVKLTYMDTVARRMS